jgi:hypothetical protein
MRRFVDQVTCGSIFSNKLKLCLKFKNKTEKIVDVCNDVYYRCAKFQLKVPYILISANVTKLEI